jgi:general secretion pathway protein D
MRRSALTAGLAAVALLLGSASAPAIAQTTVNLRDADIRAFIDDVARVTGATFVIDPRVQGKVSVVSDKPLGRNQYFELFLATLRANGYVAVPSGTGQYRVQPAEAGAGAGGARYSTAVIPLTNIDAQAAVDSLRPVLSRNGTASANRAGNAIIIADFADNIARARQVLREIDRDRSTTQVVQLRNAGARDLAQSLQRLVQQPGGEANAATAISVVPIDASNAIAIRGEANQVKRIAGIARDLDLKAAGGSESRVIFLQHADAAAVMPVLQQLMGQTPTPVQQGGGIAGLAGTPFGNRGQQQQQPAQQPAATPANVGVAAGNSRRRAIIARYEGANALIIAAPPEIQRELGEVIRQLDTRRAQVQVEAIIVEISDTAARKLGVQFLLAGRDGTVPLVSSNFSNASPNLLAISGAVAAERGLITGDTADAFREAAVQSLLGTTGLTSGIASLGGSTIFGFVINAVKSDIDSNILSTPSIMTLDNQPARILVGQEIPVTTGEALGQNLDNSFRTVQRQDVGIQLAVKPQINAGGTITLTINQVVSSIAATVADRDFILNKRELETAVTVGDGQILALGGLLDDNERRSLEKIPILGDIPGLGVFFRSKSRNRVKTNLMIFIRPTVVRSQADSDAITANRWDSVREAQEARDGYSRLDAMAWEYLRTPPPYKPAPYPAPAPGQQVPTQVPAPVPAPATPR